MTKGFFKGVALIGTIITTGCTLIVKSMDLNDAVKSGEFNFKELMNLGKKDSQTK